MALVRTSILLSSTLLTVQACGDNASPPRTSHGPISEGLSGRLGAPIPSASQDELDTFERGLAVATRRFSLGEGLGPSFNVTFCGACHEKPVIGGSAGLYRNFFLAGNKVDGDAFRFGNAVDIFDCGDLDTPSAERVRRPPTVASDGVFSGVIRQYSHSISHSARPEAGADLNIIAQRNPIPFFGVGLIAELPEEEILQYADENDRDGDGISGRPNYDGSFVGRFGVKSQTVSIEGFIRGPLFNHLGITSDPLSDEDRARLPVDSSNPEGEESTASLAKLLWKYAQAAAPGTPNCDLDDILDPELHRDELFDLVSYAMLLAAPKPEPLNDEGIRGLQAFDRAMCDRCHVPRMNGPRGPVHAYSDFLLHDMGPELADGLVTGRASGSEFRTQPLWGVAASAPYLHDGRAQSLDEAIRLHGGEADRSRKRYEQLSDTDRSALIEFLMTLGGRDQVSPGLIPTDEARPSQGEAGGPRNDLDGEEIERFWIGRTLFDTEFGYGQGVGGPRLNGDSCRACHFEPAIGGAGPRGVNVMRHGIVNEEGAFVPPQVGTVLHKTTTLPNSANFPQVGTDVYEHRQTPSLFGMGLIDGISEAEIRAGEDPFDMDGNGISGRASVVDGGQIGKFGWKAQVPSLAEFVRDAVSVELGMTMSAVEGLSFGKIHDNDNVDDPEFSLESGKALEDYMRFFGGA